MRMSRVLGFFTCLVSIAFLFIPLDATAAGFVPCGQTSPEDCTFADLVQMGRNLVNFAIIVAVPILTLLFAYGGFLYIVSGSAPAKRQQGNKVMTSGVIGFAIILLAWVGVNLILTLFIDPDKFNSSVDGILEPR